LVSSHHGAKQQVSAAYARVSQNGSAWLKLIELTCAANSAYEEQKMTDVQILCKEKSFGAHKIVICMQSKVFEAMCASGFKVRII
jgi:hypothetical protein